MQYTVFWQIKDSGLFLFNVRLPEVDGEGSGRKRHARSDRRSRPRRTIARPRAAPRSRIRRQKLLQSHHGPVRRGRADHPGAAAEASSRRPRSSTRIAMCSAPRRIASASATKPKPIATTSIPRARGEAAAPDPGSRRLSPAGAGAGARRGAALRLRLQRLQAGGGCHQAAPLSRNHGNDSARHQQGHHRSGQAASQGVVPYLPLPEFQRRAPTPAPAGPTSSTVTRP